MADMNSVRRINANQVAIALEPGVEMEFVRIPAGEFLMGSDKSRDRAAHDDELPQHRLSLPEYWMAKGPVMVGQFAAFAKATSYKTQVDKVVEANLALVSRLPDGTAGVAQVGQTSSEPTWRVGGKAWVEESGYLRHPVTHITWDDGMAFAAWATKVTGVMIDLPTEAEWEKAARGTDGRKFPWGNDRPDDSRLNFDRRLGWSGQTTEVGKYGVGGASPYGCHDMAGNVWEWTRCRFSWYPYEVSEEGERAMRALRVILPLAGTVESWDTRTARERRVLRGGGYDANVRSVRCAYRDIYFQNLDTDVMGFRVIARSLSF